MTARRSASVALAAGMLLIALARVAIPSAPPLYDGVVVVEPYRWLEPPPGKPGDPQGASATVAARKRQSPLIALATPEMVPQAQIYAVPGELSVPAGTQTVNASIEPIVAEGSPSDGHIDGNVYRISVTGDGGTPIVPLPSTRVSIVLRSTDPNAVDGTIARYSGGAWHPIKTTLESNGLFLAVVTEFGDFAVIAPGPGTSRPPGSVASASPASSAVQSAVASAPPESPGQAALVNSPLTGSNGGPPEWLVPALVLVGGSIAVALLVTWRRRSAKYRGAHRARRR